ncbi:MAG: hypothetical protein H6977_06370 [Gammaproteobacteria bacterium]|nr:hypothetical protein [Gammaproteobacteria bacterium]MCP5199616.1 hypothetical protein [Gammaproteobacteria bacterium]
MSCKSCLRLAVLGAVALLILPVQAATLGFAPADAAVTAGATIEITIVGRDFTAGAGGSIGGGLSVSWDPSMLALAAYDTSVFAGDRFFAADNTTTVHDAVAGELRDLSVLSLFGVADADFDVATLVFEGLQVGVSQLGLGIGRFDSNADNAWFDGDGLVAAEPVFVGGSLAVTAVPVPAALPLFGLPLSLLALRRRAGWQA